MRTQRARANGAQCACASDRPDLTTQTFPLRRSSAGGNENPAYGSVHGKCKVTAGTMAAARTQRYGRHTRGSNNAQKVYKPAAELRVTRYGRYAGSVKATWQARHNTARNRWAGGSAAQCCSGHNAAAVAIR